MEIHFEIENSCLLKCRHCSSRAQISGNRIEYSWEDMLAFLQQLPGKKNIFLTGGEPLQCKELMHILKALRTKVDDATIGLFTTGIYQKGSEGVFISKTYADDLACEGLEVCYCSVYSDDGEVHDWMTNYKGSYNATKAAIANLIQAGIDVKINLVVTKKNIDRVPYIINTVREWNCTEVRLLQLVKHGRATECWDEIGISYKEYRECVEKIVKEDWGMLITASGCIDLIPCRPFENAIGCQAGQELLYVTYKGDVFPCACIKGNNDYLIGNINYATSWKEYTFNASRPKGKVFCDSAD